MSRHGKKTSAMILLIVVALPTGLTSLTFTALGLMSSIHHADAIEASVGMVMLVGSSIGWLASALVMWSVVRLNRAATDQPSPGNYAP
jgi:heme/copper-type cytochrome/quinol oxidase subunit 2